MHGVFVEDEDLLPRLALRQLLVDPLQRDERFRVAQLALQRHEVRFAVDLHAVPGKQDQEVILRP